MKILKSWLNDYLSKEISVRQIEKILTLAGIEIEKISYLPDENIVVARIEAIQPHPNANKLQIVSVYDGQKTYSIVCGATNIRKGQLVPLAKIGSIVQGVEIKEVTIRGERSLGMLCSEMELGLGNDHSGIYILPNDYKIGEKLCQYYQKDSIIEISPTANRGDCLSHIGIARELAVYQNQLVKRQPVKFSKIDPEPVTNKIIVEIKDQSLCPKYMARVIKGVKVQASPEWLQERLLACGIKPINNVVDVTNYIMLDLGQPMHAFDGSKINGDKIIVRKAKNNENITTLDGEIRHLDKDILVIADENNPIAIAGIMGGKNSEVSDSTQTVVIEAANFNPSSIRTAVKKLKLSTEASYRFERGIDAGNLEYAINKAADMIVKICQGRIMSGLISVGQDAIKTVIPIEYYKIRNLLGLEISDIEINHILRLLGFNINNNNCQVPTWRHDIAVWQDLAEEVGRVFGYDKIKRISLDKKTAKKTFYYLTEKIKDFLVDLGYTETINYPFLSDGDLKLLGLNSQNLLEVENPLQPENKYLRNSLVPGLLKNIAKNPMFDEVNLFEVGHIFLKTIEEQHLAIASTYGNFDQFKNQVFSLLNKIHPDEQFIKFYHYKREQLIHYKIKRPDVYLAEISLSKIYKNKKIDQKINLKTNDKTIIYRGVSKYPLSSRDLSFVMDKEVRVEDIQKEIYKISDLINRVELFDEFYSEKIGKNKKSLAFHIFFQSFEKTLNDGEVNKLVSLIIKKVENKFKAKLRD